jgi:hypothetical protein
LPYHPTEENRENEKPSFKSIKKENNKMIRQIFEVNYTPVKFETEIVQYATGPYNIRKRIEGTPTLARVEITADMEGIVRKLAGRACNNKKGRARYLGGLIQVKRLI